MKTSPTDLACVVQHQFCFWATIILAALALILGHSSETEGADLGGQAAITAPSLDAGLDLFDAGGSPPVEPAGENQDDLEQDWEKDHLAPGQANVVPWVTTQHEHGSSLLLPPREQAPRGLERPPRA